jgi:hypothetical protein
MTLDLEYPTSPPTGADMGRKSPSVPQLDMGRVAFVSGSAPCFLFCADIGVELNSESNCRMFKIPAWKSFNWSTLFFLFCFSF